MATIEERAEQHVENDFLVKMSHSRTISDIAKSAYKAGATEQKQIDIEKAVKWLEEFFDGDLYDDHVYDCTIYSFSEFIDSFRKAMNEQ